MKKKGLKSGTIVKIPLNRNLGHLYAKVVDLTDFSKIDLSTTIHYIIYPYNYITRNKDVFNYQKFIESEPLTGGLYVMDIEPVVKKKLWLDVGDADLKGYEKIVPVFRSFSSSVFAVHKYEKDADSWRYYENGRPFTWIKAEYEKIKHIESSKILSHDLIEIRLSMEIIKRKGEKIEDFYDMEDPNNLGVYYNMLYTQPFNEVDDKLKGRVL